MTTERQYTDKARRAMPKQQTSNKQTTSWHNVGKWYDKVVGDDGHYYHQHVVLPGVKKLLNFNQIPEGSSLLDLACGQGVLARQIPSHMEYYGFDIAPALIQAAKSYSKQKKHHFAVADATKPLPLQKNDFQFATIILALQNIEHPLAALQQAYNHLAQGGRLLIVLNHPCFRIPRQSSWEIDQATKTQYRRMNRYYSPIKIPIQMNPGKGQKSTDTWSFHHPISAYVKWLKEAGFVITDMEEWMSDKVSEGGAAKMENRAREEFPLFLAVVAQK
ncbi:MAG: hypothetical protein K0S74_675 [Chlamydiales bacterium]|jgi:ubiquinone/menaquinone biosynthesis C-methylase UbiE|nr:hypothetical protein [Chlamydiales bacterium]